MLSFTFLYKQIEKVFYADVIKQFCFMVNDYTKKRTNIGGFTKGHISMVACLATHLRCECMIVVMGTMKGCVRDIETQIYSSLDQR